MYRRHLLAMSLLTIASTAAAQSAASDIAKGDQEYAALHPAAALTQYEAAITADPKNVEALWKASRTAVVLGEFSDSTRDTLYKTAEAYAQRAVDADSLNANTQFALAQALGRIALTIGDPSGRLPYSQGVYHHGTKCLKLDPTSAECAHVMGEWNAEVMRVNEGLRAMAISMLGAQELSYASWAKAQKYLLQAVHKEPNRAIHHLDLARVYADVENKVKAKAEYEAVLKAPVSDYNDPNYKAAAQQALKDLGH
jgi:tetratricopeptide (TPR) repeat protein